MQSILNSPFSGHQFNVSVEPGLPQVTPLNSPSLHSTLSPLRPGSRPPANFCFICFHVLTIVNDFSWLLWSCIHIELYAQFCFCKFILVLDYWEKKLYTLASKWCDCGTVPTGSIEEVPVILLLNFFEINIIAIAFCIVHWAMIFIPHTCTRGKVICYVCRLS